MSTLKQIHLLISDYRISQLMLLTLGALIVTCQGCGRLSVQKQLELYVEEQKKNSKLPRKISNRLTLVDIQAGEKNLIQTFRIKGPKDKIKESTATLEAEVLQELQKKKSEIENLIKFQVVMTFRYIHERSGELLHEFQVKPWEDIK